MPQADRFREPLFPPEELRKRRQWIGWRRIPDPDGGKDKKQPICIGTGTGKGYLDPANHVSYEEAVAAVEPMDLTGVGFVLVDGCGVIGFDCDHCRDKATGRLEPYSQAALDLCETYAEVSPSGAGIRMFALGSVPKTIKHDPTGVEIYGSGRYLTFTGWRVPGAPAEVHAAPKTLALLEARVEAWKAAHAKPGASQGPSGSKAGSFEDFVKAQTPWAIVNAAALANLDKWVPDLFPSATYQPGTKSWRVKSKDIGRPDLQEDLSLHPGGIRWWGTDDMGEERDGGRTPIDVVVDHKQHSRENRLLKPKEAALWLIWICGIEPDPFEAEATPPPSDDDDRAEFRLEAWQTLETPPRDFLLGSLLCTTSRWLLFGETGVGKSLVAADIAAAVAAGASIFDWPATGERRRVMYLDGEMPIETFKERAQILARRYGEHIDFYGYNRDRLGEGQMPPLNEEDGQTWLLREVDIVKPDLIIFDSIMCLLSGVMSEEESWAPVKHLVRRLTARRVAQIWLHHTGHDGAKSFGTKTREWEMDTVVRLSFTDEARTEVMMDFRKARLRTPANAREFEPKMITLDEDGWMSSPASAAPSPGSKRSEESQRVRKALLETYDRLALGVTDTPGPDG